MESLPFHFQKRPYWEFYCPICKTQRRSFYWPSPRMRHYFSLIILAVTLTVALWSWCGPRGVFLILPIWAGFEFFYRARARQSIICRHCGFDPYLYKYDVQLARQKVELFWADKLKKTKEGPVGPTSEKPTTASATTPSKER